MEQYAATGLDRNGERERKIVRASVFGIVTNVFLAAFKAAVGLLSHSIAIVLDAVNNLSDAASSLITVVGTKLAAKTPDKKHPFGYGRIEYLSAMVVSLIVLYAGLTSFAESVKKIVRPDTPEYGAASLVVVAVAVAIKLALGSFVKRVGKETDSDSLVNSGEDAAMDALISAATLLAALLFMWKHVSLEAWLGAVIALFIVKAGFGMLRETVSKVLGERVDAGLSSAIKATILSFKDVSGAYDLVLNNYGPDTFNGSIHIEVPDSYSAGDLDELIRSITVEVYKKHHVLLTAVGVYSVNTSGDRAAQMRDEIYSLALAHEHVLQLHGFYVNEAKKTIRFDMVISFDAPDRMEVYREVREEVAARYPAYRLEIAVDFDFSDP